MRTSDHRTDVSCFILPSFPLRPTQERRLSCAEGDYSNKAIVGKNPFSRLLSCLAFIVVPLRSPLRVLC